MAENQIAKVSNKHQAIAEWLVANPEEKLGVCAQKFGVTQAWLSVIINSELFQSYLEELHGEYKSDYIFPLRDKLTGVAHRAVEKLGEAVDNSQDSKFLLEAADKALHRLGYAPQRGPEPGATTPQVNNTIFVDGSVLAAARETMNRTLEGSSVRLDNDTPKELPTDTGAGRGSDVIGEARVYTPDEETGA